MENKNIKTTNLNKIWIKFVFNIFIVHRIVELLTDDDLVIEIDFNVFNTVIVQRQISKFQACLAFVQG